MLNILVSNDDGINAEGIITLANALSEIAKVTVIAPDRNRSGASNSLTLTTPLRIRKLQEDYISVEGTPTDCVHLGLTGLLDGVPDMVVSGINEGANLGDDVVYSGTVAAATEGCLFRVPAIAISMIGDMPKHYETAATIAKTLVLEVQANPIPEDTILNVNVPDLPISEIKGFEITRLGRRHRAVPTIKTEDPRGHPIYWVGPAGLGQDAGEGTDFNAIENARVSVTPLCFDLTKYSSIDTLSSWIDSVEL